MLEQMLGNSSVLGHLPMISLFFFALVGTNAVLYLLSNCKEFLVVCGVAFIYAAVPLIHHL